MNTFPHFAAVCMLPEQEDVERHSDRISLSTDPNGLQDTGVSQLAAHKFNFKHTWFLRKAKVQINICKHIYIIKCHYLW